MYRDSKPAHAGVHFPPPLLYAGGLVAGVLLNLWRPLPMTVGASPSRLAVGIAGVTAYALIFAGAFTSFRRSHTTLIPNRPASALVTGGPYRFTRNPMYVSLVMLYIGLSAFANSWWTLLLLPFVIVAIDRGVIAREEHYLDAAFPAEYGEYRSRVRRWL